MRLINGTSEPEFAIAAGQIERWRIVNASSARYVHPSLGGRPFQIIRSTTLFHWWPQRLHKRYVPKRK